MQIIRKITHPKNSLNRKLHSIFEAGDLRKILIVKEFGCTQKQNFYYILFHKKRKNNLEE